MCTFCKVQEIVTKANISLSNSLYLIKKKVIIKLYRVGYRATFIYYGKVQTQQKNIFF